MKTTNDLKLYVNSLYDRNDLLAREDGWGQLVHMAGMPITAVIPKCGISIIHG
ncbi:hypothetical protein KUH03_17075 [Sphingobacterium sp. E70]|uniref:hypothetical protein n=1 Tax=Sphingobacterium sp. E70 TaxID=2853439 RepID=UPI00211BAC26|nr:hypothetical protein [Sphingobacterium sp. E70]ULT28151.1 hypothetical protein KUH03_17075 [Sphingobacterium sp. E70]